ncbi:hypothetical protein [Streptomyces sp. NPDC004270]
MTAPLVAYERVDVSDVAEIVGTRLAEGDWDIGVFLIGLPSLMERNPVSTEVKVMVPESARFRDLRDFMDAVLVASGVPHRDVQARMRHGTLALTLDAYGFAMEADWANAPASFEELFGIPAPPGLPEAALTPRAERLGRGTRPAPGGESPAPRGRVSRQVVRRRIRQGSSFVPVTSWA